MPYITVHPPFTTKLREMPKLELLRYFQWFLSVIPQRVKQLTEALEETPGFETWQPDLTPDSLNALGKWYADQIETRPRDEEELQEIKDRLAFPVEIAKEQLTDRSFSVAMDVGMYFGQVLLKNHPQLRWEQPLQDKKFVDYGQVVLVGFSNAPLNPVRIMVVLARAIASKKHGGTRVRELYNTWSGLVIPAT